MSHPRGADQLYDKQVPRPDKSPAKTAQIQAQNRRREYLDRNPGYFTALDHELAGTAADPVLYERLVKRHQTSSERQQEGLAKGYGRVLEADLARGETRLSALATEAAGEQREDLTPAEQRWHAASIDNPWEGEASTKEQGSELWREFLRERFIRGGDDDFDYGKVDGNEEFDVVLRRDEQDRWFDDEEPSWVGDAGETGVQDF
ncbi:uncharacterized protein MAM_01224 [Metarhizium album ARSEF 1941]|uniref:CCD97-like C-terminal domain-containing protein n=1 Tax=Metarhizium album (strain ARSEF 1941) TaxID=1081103 RepID=A0A0B2X571_METAS|nr:uncharacterized protein MAM_01224 [Metarhizium album ARSEF 1941]KHO00446.1 hypothetical protein MAM_01224 [Metarhizium album ARSEF 1941]